MRGKGEAPTRIKEHVAKIKHRFGKAPGYMRVDNGKELVNDEVRRFCAEEGIIIETSAPYSPSQNGVAECFNRTLIELVRAMLIAKGLPAYLCTLFPFPNTVRPKGWEKFTFKEVRWKKQQIRL
jgi:transposase InsO family protein